MYPISDVLGQASEERSPLAICKSVWSLSLPHVPWLWLTLPVTPYVFLFSCLYCQRRKAITLSSDALWTLPLCVKDTMLWYTCFIPASQREKQRHRNSKTDCVRDTYSETHREDCPDRTVACRQTEEKKYQWKQDPSVYSSTYVPVNNISAL